MPRIYGVSDCLLLRYRFSQTVKNLWMVFAAKHGKETYNEQAAVRRPELSAVLLRESKRLKTSFYRGLHGSDGY